MTPANNQWWKVSYDFQRPFWTSYGRVVFVRSETYEIAVVRARRCVQMLEPGADILRLDVTLSTRRARQEFWRRVQASRLWKRNVAAGIPNDRRLL